MIRLPRWYCAKKHVQNDPVRSPPFRVAVIHKGLPVWWMLLGASKHCPAPPNGCACPVSRKGITVVTADEAAKNKEQDMSKGRLMGTQDECVGKCVVIPDAHSLSGKALTNRTALLHGNPGPLVDIDE